VKLSVAKVKVFRHIDPDVLTGVLHGPGRFPSSGRGLFLRAEVSLSNGHRGMNQYKGVRGFSSNFHGLIVICGGSVDLHGHGQQHRGEVEQERTRLKSSAGHRTLCHLTSSLSD
jgi:hypothetical protein